MLEDNDKIRLIERYLEGSLSSEEQIQFEDLRQKDVQFAKELEFHQKFMNSMDRVGDELFLSNLQNLEREIQAERASKNNTTNLLKDLTQKTLQKGSELLEGLAAAFLPIPQYEAILGAVSRSSDIEVLQPENGLDCENGVLQFELKKGFHQNLQLSIEDNRQNVLKEETILSETVRFEVDVKDLKAGRYYWKLKTREGLLMGSFFVRKDLMSDG